LKVIFKYQTGTHVPPDDIGANFFPQLGPYSSHDPDVIYKHMAQMHKAGVGE
jgi:glycoprotein endo-alpha-1,2-mannosidase